MGATWVYDEYVGLGWSHGLPLAEKVGLGRALQLLGAADMLPRARTFSYFTPSGTMYIIAYVEIDGVWYFTAMKDVSHWIPFVGSWVSLEFVIPPGEVPTNYRPDFASGPESVWNENAGGFAGKPWVPKPWERPGN
jgi:hypothetical protein